MKTNLALALALIAACPGLAQEPTSDRPAGGQGPMLLPAYTVTDGLVHFIPFKKEDIDLPGLGDREWIPEMFYPGQAYSDGITKGEAVVGVELDADGRPHDFMIVAYSQKYFGDALLRQAQGLTYKACKIKGVAVPSRFTYTYNFVPQFAQTLNMFAAVQDRMNLYGAPPLLFHAVSEEELDSRLQFIESAIPNLPAGYQTDDVKKVKVMVTFYVDQQGHVRLPSVGAAESPALVSNAIEAVKYWTFKPPTVHGKPALVFTGRSVGFYGPESEKPRS